MAPARLLERNVKPLHVGDFDSESEDEEAEAIYPRESEDGDSGSDASISKDEGIEPDAEGNDGVDEEAAEQDISNVSFGALMQAQDTLSRKRKRNSDVTAEQEQKLETLRKRLKEIRSKPQSSQSERRKDQKQHRAVQSGPESKAPRVVVDKVAEMGEIGGSDTDSAPSEEEAPSKSRSSKHAPASQSSKHQVTRKRTVVNVPKRVTRDPRFDAMHQSSAHQDNSGEAYSFLRDYQKDEIAELKSAIKQARNEEDKEVLKRKVVSMQNQIKSHEAKEREQDVIRQHRREEKQKVEQGKKPFYLKSKDVKDRALVEKFKGMKSKDREKLLERRKIKEGQKEKKKMPRARRIAV